MSGIAPSPDEPLRCSEPPLWANALNRCAIARCAGSPTACTATGGEIVDSVRVVLS
jgi:hypothetical protein